MRKSKLFLIKPSKIIKYLVSKYKYQGIRQTLIKFSLQKIQKLGFLWKYSSVTDKNTGTRS